MEVVVTTGAISCAKLQSNHHYQQTNTQFFYRPDARPVAQPTVSKHRRKETSEINIVTPLFKGSDLPAKILKHQGRTFTGAWEQFWLDALPTANIQ